ncbi:MAG: hypothetical protein C5B58_09955 [Acidobacteria bacterium]|nr:MAG: hypothetical protein C5B58_09955 [Acidobacteriota bacterium]
MRGTITVCMQLFPGQSLTKPECDNGYSSQVKISHVTLQEGVRFVGQLVGNAYGANIRCNKDSHNQEGVT